MAWYVVFTKGDLEGRTFDLRENVLIGIGRSSECRIKIPSSAKDVSRHHLVLRVTAKGVELTNSSSQRDATHVGTRVVPVNHRTMLQTGDRISLGMSKGTQFVLEQGDAKTSSGGATGTFTGAVTGGTAAVTGRETGAVTGGTAVVTGSETGTVAGGMAAVTGRGTGMMTGETAVNTGTTRPPPGTSTEMPSETGHGDTRELETVLVDQADIQKLIEELLIVRKRKILWRVVFFVLAFFAVAITYYLLQPSPEKILTWPLRNDGRPDIREVALGTPFGTNVFWLAVPGGADFQSEKGSNGAVRVMTRLGKQRDVPLWVTFSCESDTNAVMQSRNVLFEKKMRELTATGSWNFQASTPLVFQGQDNGLPCLGAQYLRSVRKGTETEQRYGHLLFAVWGDCILTVLREIPAVEQWRGGAILAAEPLLMVARGALMVRWEGRPDYRNEPLESMLSEADTLLASKASMHWQEVEFLLQSVLIKNVLQADKSAQRIREKALERLRDLRRQEQLEFYRLKGEWEKCKNLGDVDGCRNTISEALKIFSMPEDRRNAFFLKGGWKK